MAVIVVTGGCGFIGSNLVWTLVREGHQVRVLDTQPSLPTFHDPGTAALAKRVIHRVGDIRNIGACRSVMHGADAVVHLAAEAGVAPSIADPLHNAEVNATGTLNLLVTARDAGVKRFVFASSGAVLGAHRPPGDETTLCQPISPYGASKLAGEAYCQAFTASFGLSSASLRFSNVYGPGSLHKGSVVAEFCKRALAGGPLVIYGDGAQTRDFLYVGDLVRGITQCLEEPQATGIFHVCSGSPTTIAVLARRIQQLSQADRATPVAIEHKPARSFEVRESYFANAKAHAAFGFAPAKAFEEGVEETWQWFLAQTAHRQAPVEFLA